MSTGCTCELLSITEMNRKKFLHKLTAAEEPFVTTVSLFRVQININ